MIQDIAPHIYHNEYKPSAPDKDSFILTYENGRILLPRQNREEAITFPRFQELEGRLDNLYVNYVRHQKINYRFFKSILRTIINDAEMELYLWPHSFEYLILAHNQLLPTLMWVIAWQYQIDRTIITLNHNSNH